MRARLVTALLLAAVAVPLSAQRAPTTEVEGQHFVVVCHGGDAALADRALAAVEPVWPLVCEAFGVPSTPPSTRLRVHLYRRAADYRAADRELTGGRFGPNQAMSHWDSRSAHIAVQPPCTDGFLRRFGLPLQTQAMLAWEACHVARFSICANFRQHPGWFVDGLAAMTARRAVAQRHPDVGGQPFFQQRWWRARRLAERGELPSLARLLADGVSGLAMRDRYAVRIAFYDWALANEPERLRAIARVVRETPAGSRFAAEVERQALARLGSSAVAFRRAVRASRPRWDERVRSLWQVGAHELQQLAFGGHDAVAFAATPVAFGTLRLAGEFCIVAGPSRRLHLLLGRDGPGSCRLAITAGDGVELWRPGATADAAECLGRRAQPQLPVDAFVPFELRVRGRALELQLGACHHKFELDTPLVAPIVWGVGAAGADGGADTIGTAGIWRRLRAGPLE